MNSHFILILGCPSEGNSLTLITWTVRHINSSQCEIMDMVRTCNSFFFFFFLVWKSHAYKKHSSKIIYPPNQHKVVQLRTRLQQHKHYELAARGRSLKFIYFTILMLFIFLIFFNPWIPWNNDLLSSIIQLKTHLQFHKQHKDMHEKTIHPIDI